MVMTMSEYMWHLRVTVRAMKTAISVAMFQLEVSKVRADLLIDMVTTLMCDGRGKADVEADMFKLCMSDWPARGMLRVEGLDPSQPQNVDWSKVSFVKIGG